MQEINNESSHAVSIYQNEGMDDFPVLKAFQQYIDAEQEKARKRILMLGIFFGAVLIIVIAVFMFLLHGINVRNQALSDRLVDYAMQDAGRRPAPIAAPQPTANDAALKAMTDTLVSLQKKLEQTETKANAVPSDKAVDRTSQELDRARQKIAEERKRLAEEKERLHQIEIEQQRRKLYPELYETHSKTKSHVLTDDDIREIIREAYSDVEKEDRVKKAEPVSKVIKKTEMDESEPSIFDSDDGPIEYFNDDDYTIPVDIKGSSSKVKFTVPVE